MKKYLCLLILVLMLGACNMPINPYPHCRFGFNGSLWNLNPALRPTLLPCRSRHNPPFPQKLQPSTPTETPTLTPTFTNTPNAEDPAIRLGEPTKVEEFDTPSGTWSYEDDWFYLNVNDGRLNIYSKGTPYWNSWYTIGPAIRNFYLEATLTMPNCNGKDRAGLAFPPHKPEPVLFYGAYLRRYLGI